MSPSEHPSRREFLRKTVATGLTGLAAETILPATARRRRKRTDANDRIHLGIIGVGSMGRSNLKNCAEHDDVEVTGVCDVWRARRDAVVKRFEKSAKAYHDYREMLEQKDIDAIIIATPPHWHALQAIDACAAGKDIYLQKPMTLYPDESLAVRNAVRRHGRICQIGTQIHAGENFRRVVEYIRTGKLGHVSTVRTFNVMNLGVDGLGTPHQKTPPKDLDWNRWVGPAPMYPFNEFIVRNAGDNCSFMRFSGGWTPGMAPHIIDLPHWALDLDFPVVTSCSGGRFTTRDVGDAPDTQEVLWQYPDRTMTWSMSTVNSFGFDFGRGSLARRLGIYFQGVNGTLFANYGMHEVVPEGGRLKDAEPPQRSIPASRGHEREWLDCLKSRKQPSCNADYHAKIDMAIGLANLSYRLQRSVRFDAETEKIVGDTEAARLARPQYRAPHKFPASYLSV